MKKNKHIFTKEGFEKLKKELEHLKTVTRKEISAKLDEARSYGDLSENAAYTVALEARDMNELKIAELEDQLYNGEIVDKVTRSNTNDIDIGSVVLIRDDENLEMEFTVVGSGETDIMAKKFDLNSPLVQSLVGKKVNDKVVVKLPSGERTVTIVSIKN